MIQKQLVHLIAQVAATASPCAAAQLLWSQEEGRRQYFCAYTHPHIKHLNHTVKEYIGPQNTILQCGQSLDRIIMEQRISIGKMAFTPLHLSMEGSASKCLIMCLEGLIHEKNCNIHYNKDQGQRSV